MGKEMEASPSKPLEVMETIPFIGETLVSRLQALLRLPKTISYHRATASMLKTAKDVNRLF